MLVTEQKLEQKREHGLTACLQNTTVTTSEKKKLTRVSANKYSPLANYLAITAKAVTAMFAEKREHQENYGAIPPEQSVLASAAIAQDMQRDCNAKQRKSDGAMTLQFIWPSNNKKYQLAWLRANDSLLVTVQQKSELVFSLSLCCALNNFSCNFLRGSAHTNNLADDIFCWIRPLFFTQPIILPHTSDTWLQSSGNAFSLDEVSQLAGLTRTSTPIIHRAYATVLQWLLINSEFIRTTQDIVYWIDLPCQTEIAITLRLSNEFRSQFMRDDYIFPNETPPVGNFVLLSVYPGQDYTNAVTAIANTAAKDEKNNLRRALRIQSGTSMRIDSTGSAELIRFARLVSNQSRRTIFSGKQHLSFVMTIARLFMPNRLYLEDRAHFPEHTFLLSPFFLLAGKQSYYEQFLPLKTLSFTEIYYCYSDELDDSRHVYDHKLSLKEKATEQLSMLTCEQLIQYCADHHIEAVDFKRLVEVGELGNLTLRELILQWLTHKNYTACDHLHAVFDTIIKSGQTDKIYKNLAYLYWVCFYVTDTAQLPCEPYLQNQSATLRAEQTARPTTMLSSQLKRKATIPLGNVAKKSKRPVDSYSASTASRRSARLFSGTAVKAVKRMIANEAVCRTLHDLLDTEEMLTIPRATQLLNELIERHSQSSTHESSQQKRVSFDAKEEASHPFIDSINHLCALTKTQETLTIHSLNTSVCWTLANIKTKLLGTQQVQHASNPVMMEIDDDTPEQSQDAKLDEMIKLPAIQAVLRELFPEHQNEAFTREQATDKLEALVGTYDKGNNENFHQESLRRTPEGTYHAFTFAIHKLCALTGVKGWINLSTNPAGIHWVLKQIVYKMAPPAYQLDASSDSESTTNNDEARYSPSATSSC